MKVLAKRPESWVHVPRHCERYLFALAADTEISMDDIGNVYTSIETLLQLETLQGATEIHANFATSSST